jgi:hypothetical protein
MLKSTYSQLNYLNLIIKETDDTDSRQLQKSVKKFVILAFMSDLQMLLKDINQLGQKDKLVIKQSEVNLLEQQEIVEEMNVPNLEHLEMSYKDDVKLNQFKESVIVTTQEPIEGKIVIVGKDIQVPTHPPIHPTTGILTTEEMAANSTNAILTTDQIYQMVENQIDLEHKQKLHKLENSSFRKDIHYFTYIHKNGRKYIDIKWIEQDTQATISIEEKDNNKHIAQLTYDLITDTKHAYKYIPTNSTQLKLMMALAKFMYINKHVRFDPIRITTLIKENYRRHIS